MNRLNLFSTLNIRPGEGWLVSWMLIYALFMGLPSLLTETTAYSLFLAEFDAHAIPYVYIGFAVVTTASGFIYTFLEKRVSFSKFATINLLVLALSLCLFRFFLLIPQASWSRLALAIWYESSWALANLGFWGLAVHLFNIRQSKRLFGLIGIGLTLSESLSGFLIPALVRLVGTPNLLLVAAASFGGALLVQTYILSSAAAQPSTSPEEIEAEKTPRNQSALTDLFKDRYIVLIFAFAALYALSFYALDYAFYDRVELRFPDADQLASFLGVFFGLTGLLTLLVGAFISGRFLGRYGLRTGLLAMPIVLLGGVSLIAITGSFIEALMALFWLVIITKLLNEVLAYTINRAAWQILYEPLPANRRLRAQTVVESMIKPMAGGLAGLLLLALNAVFSLNAVQISYLLVFILIAWLGVVVMLNRLYPTMLLQALTRRKLGDTAFVVDKSSVAVLKQGLSSPHLGVVIYALNMLEEIEPESLPAFLQKLLNHPAPEIRLNALQRVERFGLTSALPAVRNSLKNDPSTAVRSVSLRTLASLGGIGVCDEVYAYLDDPDPLLKMGAMVGLLRSGTNGHIGHNGTPTVRDKLVELVESPDPFDRKFAARVIYETGIEEFSPLLQKLLQDDDFDVQRSALFSVRKLPRPALWPVVIERLALPKARSEAMATLAAVGPTILPELRSAFTQAGQSREVRLKLAQLFGRIRGPEATAFLQDNLNYPDAQIRFHILKSLSQCGYRAEGDQRVHTEQVILAEAARATWLPAAIIDLGDDESGQLLKSALDNELNQHLARIFLLLSFIFDTQTILQIGNTLQLTANSSTKPVSAEKRAYALEIFEMLIPAQLKTVLLPLIDDLTPGQRLQHLSALFPQDSSTPEQRLQEIINGSEAWFSPWTKMCALYAVTQLSANNDLSEAVISVLYTTSVPLVKEMAIWTLYKIAPERLKDYARELGRDPNPQIRKATEYLTTKQRGNRLMLSLIEKVIFLKAVNLFSQTPEEVLAELAAVLEELEIQAGETVIEKDQPGSSLYIIIDGQVQVHNGDEILKTIGARDVFGELSILDPGPRAASVTAIATTRLLRLDQEPFYELIDDHSVVARRIIQILGRQLRFAYAQAQVNRPVDNLLNHVQHYPTQT